MITFYHLTYILFGIHFYLEQKTRLPEQTYPGCALLSQISLA